MQSEVDDVLREALDCYDDGAIKEGDLAAISLVLDQLSPRYSPARLLQTARTARSRASASISRAKIPAECNTSSCVRSPKENCEMK